MDNATKILTLLQIAERAHGWPQTLSLSQRALSEAIDLKDEPFFDDEVEEEVPDAPAPEPAPAPTPTSIPSSAFPETRRPQ
jgi:hypothetical protein